MKKQIWFNVFLLILALASPGLWSQARLGSFSQIWTSDTSAYSIMAGCAVGATDCTGGIYGGAIVAATSVTTPLQVASGTAPASLLTDTNAASNEKIWGWTGHDGPLYLEVFSDNLASSSTLLHFTRSGSTALGMHTDTPIYTDNQLLLTGTQNATTGDSDQTITLSAATTVARITTGGTVAADPIIGFTGGAAGRMLLVCNLDSTSGATRLRAEDSGATAANRMAGSGTIDIDTGRCVQLWYDGTSSRWRFLQDNGS